LTAAAAESGKIKSAALRLMQAIQLLYVPSICDEFQQDRPKEQRQTPWRARALS